MPMRALTSWLYEREGASKLAILKTPHFLFGLLLKCVLAFLFAGPAFVRGYAPFVDYFLKTGFDDPYRFFAQTGALAFPYPNLMLFILAIPRFLLRFIGSVGDDVVSHADVFIYRLPIFAADIVIFLVLARWLKHKQQKVLWYYWYAPVLLFINYILGELDAIPMALLFVFLYFLFKDKLYPAFVFLGLTLAAKMGMVLIVPFVAVYLLVERIPWRRAVACIALAVGIFAAANIRHIVSPWFFTAIFNAPLQANILSLNIPLGGGTLVYLAPIVYLALLVKSVSYRRFNRDIFLMFLGFAMAIITLFMVPRPGWYYWIIPFFIYFLVRQERANVYSFALLQVAYLGYFLTLKDSAFASAIAFTLPSAASFFNIHAVLGRLPWDPSLITNLLFSGLQGMLFLHVVWIYRQGIESMTRLKMSYHPYFIGVAGDSGSGKTVLTQLLADVFGEHNALTIAGDDMHKWERGDINWALYTHLNPQANKLHDDVRAALRLKVGKEVARERYDHDTGKFTLPQRLAAKRVVLFQGLHALYLGRMRELLDLKIFLQPDETLRRHWKIRRDILERGHARERVEAQLDARAEDAEKYIHAQAKHADIVISLINKEPVVEPGGFAEPPLYLRMICGTAVDLEPLRSALAAHGTLAVRHAYESEQQTLECEGAFSARAVEECAYALTPELWEVLRVNPRWAEGYNGVMQLFVCYCIFYSMRHYESV